MSEYTPTTKEVRDVLIAAAVESNRGAYKRIARVETGKIFDRWLAEHDAALVDKLAKRIIEARRSTWGYVDNKAVDPNGDVSVWLFGEAKKIREGEGNE